LFPVVLEIIDPFKQEELVDLFVKLGEDEFLKARKAAAANIGLVFAVVPSNKLVQLFKNLISDENESVRQMTIRNITKLIVNPSETLEILKNFSEDKS
jgi:HEAT repeat.